MNRPFGLIAAGLLASCASYEARPIDPLRSEMEYRNRSLADAGLRDYLRSKAAVADPIWDLTTLTFTAFYYHPDIDVARARVGIAEAGVMTAGAIPNPTAGIGPQYVTNAESGVRPWVLGFNLDIPIETAGKRGYRIEQAECLTEAARFELAQVAWQVRSRLRAALAEHLFAVREVELLRNEADARSEAASLTERKLKLGEVSRPDLDAAQIELATIQLAIRAAEGRVAESRTNLSSALGLPNLALEGVSLSWPDLERPPTESTVLLSQAQRAGLLNRLDVRKALAEYAAAEAALHLEVARQYPDIHLGPGYEYDQGDNKFRLGLSVTLPILNQNGGPIAEAEARRQEVGARFLSLQARAIAETEQALARFRAALRELGDAEDLVKLLEKREQSAKRAVELGDEDRLSLAGIRVQRAVVNRARLDTLRRVQSALGALEDAVQRPLTPGGVFSDLPPSSPRGNQGKAGDR